MTVDQSGSELSAQAPVTGQGSASKKRRRLVAPHPSTVKPSVPAGAIKLPRLTYTLDELTEYCGLVMEDTTAHLGDQSEGRKGYSQGVQINWKTGGNTTCHADELTCIERPETVAGIALFAGYDDDSYIQFMINPGSRGTPMQSTITWSGIGEGRERAEAILARATDRNVGLRKMEHFMAGRAGILSIQGAGWVIWGLLVAVLGERVLPDPMELRWGLVVIVIASVVAALGLHVFQRWLRDGRLRRCRRKRDWVALTGIATYTGAGVALLVGLLAALK